MSWRCRVRWRIETRISIRVKPIPRTFARLDLAGLVEREHLTDTAQVVDYLLARFLTVPIDTSRRDQLVAFLDRELGTREIARARTYMEEPLRMLVHLILSMPEYQLG